jgi:hypothetical protein
MKVVIGPYRSWIGPYQLADLLLHLGVSGDRCRSIGEWLASSWVNTVCEWIHSKKHRKIKVQIDKYDTWSMDSTLAIIILPMLKQLKETKHGSPGSMPAFQQTSNDAQFCLDFYEEGDELAWDTGRQQWEAILDEMIWTFEQLQPGYDWEDQYWITHPEMDLDEYPEDEGKTSVPVRWKVEGDCDWDGMKAHAARIDAGLVLFGQYYRNLWS